MSIQLVVGPEALSSYRRLAYSPWHAIAEFVDNSTQSYFDHRQLLDTRMQAEEQKILSVAVVYDRHRGLLRVTDNAMGMSLEELDRALHIALPPTNPGGRSKYGLGMKTAACWMGNKWTITTKRLGEPVEHSVIVNVDGVVQRRANGVVYSNREKSPDLHYTIVEIVEMHRTFHGRTLGKIGQFLCSMYRSDLRAGRLELRWRDQILQWKSLEPELLVDREGNSYRKHFEFAVDEKTVRGWVGVLDKGSRAKAGFSIFQADRVVKGWPDAWRPSSLYGQLQGSNDLVNQRLVGEVHLDGFEVSHTKDDILWRNDEEEEVEQKLREHCADYREFAKHRRKSKDDERGPSDLEVKAALEELERELGSPEMVDQINLVGIPDAAAIDANNVKIIEGVVGSRTATLQGVIAGNPEISWKIFLEAMSPNDPYVVSDSAKARQITVIVNTAHPYWSTQLAGSESVLDYLRHCMYDSVAEWQARLRTSHVDAETVKLLKDQLLRVPLRMESHEGEAEAAVGLAH